MSLLIGTQQQPTFNSCTCTSIAMICGMPAPAVIQRFHQGYENGEFGFGHILRELNIPYRSFASDETQSIKEPGAYLLCVPSLNIPGGFHNLVVEMSEEGQWIVHDPVMGREGKKYYSAVEPRHELEVKLSSFAIDAYVSRDYLCKAYAYRLNGEAA